VNECASFQLNKSQQFSARNILHHTLPENWIATPFIN